jgi:hypothetical protein
MSATTTYGSGFFAQMLQQQSSALNLPPLDKASLVPSFDVRGMMDAIATLWDALGHQRSLFEAIEKDAQRRKMEQEVKFNNLREDLERRLAEEAHKRNQEVERLQREIVTLRDENKKMHEQDRADAKATEAALRDTMAANAAAAATAVSLVREDLRATDATANAAKREAAEAGVKATEVATKLHEVSETLNTDLNNLHGTLGLTRDRCKKAVTMKNEKETMLATPALAHVLDLIKAVPAPSAVPAAAGEKVIREVIREVAPADGVDAVQMAELAKRVARVEDKTTATENLLAQSTDQLRDEDSALRKRIDALEASVAGLQSAGPAAAAPAAPITTANGDGIDADALNAALAKIRSDVAALRAGLNGALDDIGRKADRSEVDAIATKHNSLEKRVAALEDALAAMRAAIDEALRLARQAAAKASAAASNGGKENSTAGTTVDPAALLALRGNVEALAARVAALENIAVDHENRKLDRDEHNKAIQDVLRAMEHAIAALYDELRRALAGLAAQTASAGGDQDATAGRFRCLSCNRGAGPLQQPMHERMSGRALPPGGMLMSANGVAIGGGLGGGSSLPPPPVPGARDGYDPRPATGSRRRIQEYFNWMQERGASLGGTVYEGTVPTSASAPVTPRPDSVSPAEVAVNAASVRLAEQPPANTEITNPVAATGNDGRTYMGAQSGYPSGTTGRSSVSRPMSANVQRGSIAGLRSSSPGAGADSAVGPTPPLRPASAKTREVKIRDPKV